MKLDQNVDVVLLPTKNYTTDYTLQSGEILSVVKLEQLILNTQNNQLLINKNSSWSATCDTDILIPYHIYIISNETLKYGDYMLVDNKIEKVKWLSDSKGNEMQDGLFANGYIRKYCKKVISSTDNLSNTIINYLPSLPIAYIEYYITEYNKGNQITNAIVKLEDNGCEEWIGDDISGEPFWNEKIELKINPINNTIFIDDKKDNWSREEMIDKLISAVAESHDWSRDNNDVHSIHIIKKQFLDNWIENNL